jgi:hypothetical protein
MLPGAPGVIRLRLVRSPSSHRARATPGRKGGRGRWACRFTRFRVSGGRAIASRKPRRFTSRRTRVVEGRVYAPLPRPLMIQGRCRPRRYVVRTLGRHVYFFQKKKLKPFSRKSNLKLCRRHFSVILAFLPCFWPILRPFRFSPGSPMGDGFFSLSRPHGGRVGPPHIRPRI